MIKDMLSIKEVSARTLLSRAEIQRRLADHSFPEPFTISPSRVVWAEADIDKWIEARPRATDYPVRKAAPPTTAKH